MGEKKGYKDIRIIIEKKSSNFQVKRNKLLHNKQRTKDLRIKYGQINKQNKDLKNKISIMKNNLNYQNKKLEKLDKLYTEGNGKKDSESKNATKKKEKHFFNKNQIFELEKEIYNLEIICNTQIRKKRGKIEQYDRLVELKRQADIDLEELDKEINAKEKLLSGKKEEYAKIDEEFEDLMSALDD